MRGHKCGGDDTTLQQIYRATDRERHRRSLKPVDGIDWKKPVRIYEVIRKTYMRSMTEVAEKFDMKTSSVRYRRKQWKEHGFQALFPRKRGRRKALSDKQATIVQTYWVAYLPMEITLIELEALLIDHGFEWVKDPKQLWREIKRAGLKGVEDYDRAVQIIEPDEDQLKAQAFRETLKEHSYRPPKGNGPQAFLSDEAFQCRWEAIRESLLRADRSKTEIAQKHEINRSTFYEFMKRYLKFGLLGLFTPPLGPRTDYVCTPPKECEVIQLWERYTYANRVAKHADLPLSTVKKIFRRFGLKQSAQSLKEIRKKLRLQKYVALERGVSGDPYLENYIDQRFVRFIEELERMPLNICMPGAILMAPFVAELRLDRLIHRLGLTKQHGFSMFQIFLVDVNRKLLGLKNISHLDSVTDRSLALGCGFAQLPHSSTEHENLFRFNKQHIRRFRLALARRTLEVGIAEGSVVAIDLHLIEYYGKDKILLDRGNGPHGTKKRMVSGDRALLAYDVEAGCPLILKRYDAKVRGETVLEQFLEEVVEVSLGLDRMSLALADAEFPSEEILDLFYRKGLPMVMAYPQYQPIKRVAKEYPEKFIPGPVGPESYFVCALKVDGRLTRYTLILGRNPDGRIFAFSTTEPLLELEPDARVAEAERLIHLYRQRARIEVCIKEEILCYYVENKPSSDEVVVDTHFLSTLVAEFAVHLLQKKSREVFGGMSLDTLRRHCLVEKNAVLSIEAGNLHVHLLDPPRTSKHRLMLHELQRLLEIEDRKVPYLNNYGVRLTFDDTEDDER